jgi:hypothetical protein
VIIGSGGRSVITLPLRLRLLKQECEAQTRWMDHERESLGPERKIRIRIGVGNGNGMESHNL